jgi:hypothetical protein
MIIGFIGLFDITCDCISLHTLLSSTASHSGRSAFFGFLNCPPVPVTETLDQLSTNSIL